MSLSRLSDMVSDCSSDDEVIIQSYTVHGKQNALIHGHAQQYKTVQDTWIQRPISVSPLHTGSRGGYTVHPTTVSLSDDSSSELDWLHTRVQPSKQQTLKRALIDDDSECEMHSQSSPQFNTPVSKRICVGWMAAGEPAARTALAHTQHTDTLGAERDSSPDLNVTLLSECDISDNDGGSGVQESEADLSCRESEAEADMEPSDMDPSHTINTSNSDTWLSALSLGDELECLDCTKRWYQCQVMQTNVAGVPTRVKVHYKGWSVSFDEVLDFATQPHRFAPLRTHTTKPYCNYYFSTLAVGDRVDVQWVGEWCVGVVVRCDAERIAVTVGGSTAETWYERCDTVQLARLHKYTGPDGSTASVQRIVIEADSSDVSEAELDLSSGDEWSVSDSNASSNSLSSQPAEHSTIGTNANVTDDAMYSAMTAAVPCETLPPSQQYSDTVPTVSTAHPHSHVARSVFSAMRAVTNIGLTAVGALAVNAMYKACREVLADS